MAIYGFRNNRIFIKNLEVDELLTFNSGDFTSTTGPIASTADSRGRLAVWANGTTYYVPLY